MASQFENFIGEIPGGIHLNTETYVGENVAIFKPKRYVTGQKMYFEDYHFVLFHENSPTIKIGKKEYQFRKGSFISMEPGMDLTVLPVSMEGKAKFTSICMNKDFFRGIALEATEKEPTRVKEIQGAYSRQLLDIIGSFCSEILNYGTRHPLMMQSIATQLAFQLLRDTCVPPCKHTGINARDGRFIEQAIEYMESFYGSNITINDVCRNIYFSPAHFKRVFKHYTGKTPHQYLIGVRIQKAKELLKSSEYSIADTARNCGFINAGHFSNVFKQVEGITPSEFRGKIYY